MSKVKDLEEIEFKGEVGDYVWVNYDLGKKAKFPGRIIEKKSDTKYIVEISLNKKKSEDLELREVEALAIQLSHRKNIK